MSYYKYGDYPKEIQECIKLEVEKVGKVYDPRSRRNAMTHEGGFDWDVSIQGREFWTDVLSEHNIDRFYERFPHLKNRIDLISEEPYIYYGTVNNKKVKITITYET